VHSRLRHWNAGPDKKIVGIPVARRPYRREAPAVVEVAGTVSAILRTPEDPQRYRPKIRMRIHASGEPVDLRRHRFVSGAGGPSKGIVMECSKYVGRIGALAVALGIGTALAMTPASAWADSSTSNGNQHTQGQSSASGANKSSGSTDSANPPAPQKHLLDMATRPQLSGVGGNHQAAASVSSAPATPVDPAAPSIVEQAALAWSGRTKRPAAASGPTTAAATVPAAASGPVTPLVSALATTIGLVMGGSGQPLPNFNLPGFIELADKLYIHPNFPDTTYPDPYANGLFTPEYPVGSLPFYLNYPEATSGVLAGFPELYTSIGQGMLILENAIKTNLANGVSSTVFGYSQSSVIAGLVMKQLAETGVVVPDGALQFVLIGNTAAPNGGLAERFVGQNLPSVGMAFDGATPSNLYPTDMYTIEYDGLGGDFPKYPINFLADLNAAMGYLYRHGLFLSLTSDEVNQAVLLPGSKSLGADSLTDYYMIPSTALPGTNSYLPLLQPLLGLPVIGKPLADLVQPALTVLINLGYGGDNLGYSTPANVPTPFGLFPDVNVGTVVNELIAGIQQGVTAFVGDIRSALPAPASAAQATSQVTLPTLPQLAAGLSAAATHPAAAISDIASTLAAEITHIAESITNIAVALYNPLLPTAGIVNAFITTLPAYDVSLFLNNLSNPINAIGLPIAADVGLVTLMAALDAQIWINGIVGAIGWFFAIFTPVSAPATAEPY
jgi:hypothetical protein